MLKQDVDALKVMLREYGPSETVNGLVVALRMARDEWSDMGLKEKAAEADGIAFSLEMVMWGEFDPYEY